MPSGRIFQDHPLAVGERLTLTQSASHYLLRVLRVKVGESIIVFNGSGGEYQAVITSLSKHSVIVQLEQFNNINIESPIHIELGQALLRGDKMDWVIQKAVELGVSIITPLLTERVGVKLHEERLTKRLEHWRGIAVSACEQSGRCVIPIVHAPVDISVWTNSLKIPSFVAIPGAEGSLPVSLDSKQVRVMIGPEGGLSRKDLEFCSVDCWHQFSMGPRVLRTETAAISAVTIMQMQWGDILR